LLRRDVAALSPSADATLRCFALPSCVSTAHQLGIAYVIEGSTLGGKFILARLPPALAALRGVATAFLEGYGAATGARWKSFGAIVERLVTSPAAEAEAVAGARETLARFERPEPRRIADAS
jgi:heme oxygenase